MGLSADNLTSEEALARVVAQWNAPGAHRVPTKASAFTLAAIGQNMKQQTAYYVFDRAQGGYIVAAADDQQPAILARIDEGRYNAEELPDGFKAWLSEVAEYGVAVPAKAPASSMAPLLDDDMIAWGQQTPYNTDCPKFNYQGYPYETLAGCAAIAVGQIMRYHKWPLQGSGHVNYDSYIYVQGQEFVTKVDRTFGSYDWSLIRGNYQYTGTGTKAERAEVAKFVADVACACKMNFDPVASATTDLEVAKALKQYFDYDPSLQLLDHCYYTTEQWANMLRAEIDAKRPVYLSGANVTNTADGDAIAGHAFVCDGYKADGTFHINWGWNGTANGDFLLTALNPTNQGAGGSAGGYSFMAAAITGIQPNHGGAETPAFLTLTGEYWETSYDNENDGYIVRVNLANPTATDFEGFVALRLMEGDTELLAPKQLAWKLGCKAGASGTLGKGVNKNFFLEHPTARLELVYAHKPGVNTATNEELTAMLESITPSEWLPIAAREGSPKSLQTFVDSKQNIVFGNKADEVFQLRLAGLTSDVTPKAGVTVKFTATVTNLSNYEYFAPFYLFVYDRAGNFIDYSSYNLHHLAPHATQTFDFDMTLPAGFSTFAVAYEDKGYDWGYVPMQLYTNENAYSTGLFDPVLQPSDGGFTYGDADQNGVTNVDDVKAVGKMVLKQQPATPTSDVDGNGKTTIGDIPVLIKYLLNTKK